MTHRFLHGTVLGTVLGLFAAGPANAMGGGGEVVIVANQEPQSMQAQRLALTRQGEVRYCLKTPYPRFRY